MRRLSCLNARMPDPRLIKPLQRLASTMVKQRASPESAHYEMSASLDFFNAERFCCQQDLAQLVTVLVAQGLNVDFVLGLDLDWTALRTGVLELHRVVVPSSSGAAAVSQPEHDNLGIARFTIRHGKGAFLPPELGPLPALLNGRRR
jgi:hypothetical protein